jgi:hypothetical protein
MFRINGLEMPRGPLTTLSIHLLLHLVATGRFVALLPGSVCHAFLAANPQFADRGIGQKFKVLRGLLAGKSLSVRVMAVLLQKNKDIKYSCTRRPLTRRQALALEEKIIDRLLRRGVPLTNYQLNPFRHTDVTKVQRDGAARARPVRNKRPVPEAAKWKPQPNGR